MDKNKLVLAATILVSSLILGGFFYASQVNKQESIERQQFIQLQADRSAETAKAEKEKIDATFSNNLKCQTLLKDLKQRWNNVVGIYYSDWQNTCVVKYTIKGEVKESPIESMQDSN